MKAFSASKIIKFLPICLVLSFFLYCAQDLRLNTTASMLRGIYLVSDGDLERGSLVEVCLDADFAGLALERGYLRAGRCESGVMPLVKSLVGLPGDEIALTPAGIEVNGIPLPNSQLRQFDTKSRPMHSHLQSEVIPAGKAFVFSDHSGGFDGRYFGLLNIHQLKTVHPLFTF